MNFDFHVARTARPPRCEVFDIRTEETMATLPADQAEQRNAELIAALLNKQEHALGLTEAAMCLWEEVMERFRADDDAVRRAFQAVGAADLRLQVASLAEPCFVAHHAATRNGYDDPFDWNFVPQWLQQHAVFDERGVTLKEPVHA